MKDLLSPESLSLDAPKPLANSDWAFERTATIRSSGFLPILAQTTSIEPKIESFLRLIQLLLLPVIVGLVAYGAWAVHEGKIREGILAIVGGLILALAVPIAKLLFAL